MSNINWETICNVSDINKNTGVCALHNGEQVAIFKVGKEEQLFALQNYDPFGEANVLSRGIIGDVDGQLVLASPLYKQQFSLESGKCLEDDSVILKTYMVRQQDGLVQLQA
ncbi:nitrite reductase small subunit [Psychrosphaera saromensis]|jgi:nitrite reductase (NADH) small subunit|uniref:Nitrite reductase small subunit n=1 Tax=Psychrosphaera saromensis TaxID=716813 RepID=A0A2S7USE9_9GAMM|nr:nitrite reductase small subunit NirD [Psychrosphaera saromensis]PQJ52675.1 nitrite reductase small subunit [Psychrosphaera saromensis]GHB70407.1 nitrite reductase small subunit [Psychrosphaera saromensis]GLQ13159.1 nitrite reductase small subunit [Psychrosphaera saromensis]